MLFWLLFWFPLNNPYPASDSLQKIYYSSFTAQPKTLDPAKSYSAEEVLFTSQILEPLFSYAEEAPPYRLIPATATQMPQIEYHKNDNVTVYTIHIKPGILYQPHPALPSKRTLVADDYVYEIKRLADPAVSSPIYGLMREYIVGFDTYATRLSRETKGQGYLDLRRYPLEGVRSVDPYTLEIKIKGQYSQFIFWLAMPFFSPIPWEVDQYYSRQGSLMSFSWNPVGTGPFMMTENNPNARIMLKKNPNYRLAEKVQLDKAIFTLEKESIPRWIKFLQGYYDLSGVSTDAFDSVIQINAEGKAVLTSEMQAKGLRLDIQSDPSIFYFGFNMLDPVVGGSSERARKLRLAISIAINYEENIALFLNGRGKPAQSPLPPGIFGYKEGRLGMNPYVYRWGAHGVERRSIAEAKALMTAAGYPHGRDPSTGKALLLNYDVPATGGADDKASLDWMQKQFEKIGIALNIRATLYNRFQEKMRTGNVQMYSWGWNADYPDPENFFFLLYGPNGKVKHGGENASNYHNLKFDALYSKMKSRPNDEERQRIIDEMINYVRYDSPWVFGIYSQSLTLSHSWVAPIKPNPMITGTLKNRVIDFNQRERLRLAWNKPIVWPLFLMMGIIVLIVLPVVHTYRKKQQAAAKRVGL